MLTRPYGRTGKNISVIGFGGMRFDNPADHDANARLVVHGFRKGINYFDTAPGYCGDHSEDIFGAAFRHMPREKFYCSSKCMAADGGKFRAGLERSLKRLGVEVIAFFHIWCVVKPEEWQQRKDGGAIAAAIKAKQEGLIKHVVTSVHLSGPETCKILEEAFIEGLTIGYNALNFPFRQEALDCARRRGIGVVTMNPLGGGLIPTHAEKLRFLMGRGDRDVVQAAIRFNLSHPAITSALVGFTTTEQVDQAVAAVEGFRPHTVAHVEKVKAQIGQAFDGFCTMCGYCMSCPAEVPISKFMESYNYKILGGGDKGITDRLNWHWDLPPDEAATCTQCGQCERLCTQHLPIMERLAHIAGLKK